MNESTTGPDRRALSMLRRVLLSDAGFSGLSGVALVFGCVPIDRLLGLGAPLAVAAVGIGLLPYSWSLLREARRPAPRPGEVVLSALLDLGWVAASLVILAVLADRLTAFGTFAFAIVGIVVLGFAGFKALGLARLATVATVPAKS
ncbi:MAG: hypothetical protein HKM95_03925 [Inquilinus sp.]|nr:hypothetical protein [Inquilinus sp.]